MRGYGAKFPSLEPPLFLTNHDYSCPAIGPFLNVNVSCSSGKQLLSIK